MRYELFIGLRYLQARRRETFISLITLISICGVMIGVMTLNVVMSVMTGFEETLRDRLLGINAHIALVRSGEPMRDYESYAANEQGAGRGRGVADDLRPGDADCWSAGHRRGGSRRRSGPGQWRGEYPEFHARGQPRRAQNAAPDPSR